MTTALPTNITGWTGLGEYANTVTSNLFWILMLASICIVVFVIVYKRSGENAASAFFGTAWAWFILSILFAILEFVPSSFVMIGLGALGFSMLGLALTKERF